MFQKWESNPYEDYRGVVANVNILKKSITPPGSPWSEVSCFKYVNRIPTRIIGELWQKYEINKSPRITVGIESSFDKFSLF